MEDSRTQPVENPRAADGRVPGRRGRATRQRLLDETRDLLGEVAYRDLKVVVISRQAGTSPATFYQYFPDVEAAVLSLTETMVEDGSRTLRMLVTDPGWDGPEAARALADGFLSFFDEHQAMLRVVDLATTEGDERFRLLRIRLLNGVFLSLQDLAYQAGVAGRLADGVEPGAAAGVLTTMLAHVSAHQPGYEAWGVERDALAETMATMIDWTVRGHQG
jgi:AcrR family transcriptional regulator